MTSVKQKKLAKLASENLNNLGKTRNMQELAIQAGYAPTTARKGNALLESKGGIEASNKYLVDSLNRMCVILNKYFNEMELRDFSQESLSGLNSLATTLGNYFKLISEKGGNEDVEITWKD